MSRQVLDARFIPPVLPGHHVVRARLLARLDEAIECPVTLLSAGAGTGKTVLLSTWARRRPGIAWMSLDAAHDQPRSFWAAVRDAFRAAGLEGGADPPYEDEGTPAVVAGFVAAASSGTPLVLVLDDLHVIRNADVLNGIDECVRRWGSRLRLVISARSDPLLPLPRYRLAATMTEIRASELAMTQGETRTLLDSYEIKLDERQLERLYVRTDGWVAAVRLSAMRMQGTARPEAFVAELALDRGSIGEYLIEEVVNCQPPDVRRLLVETSFLDTVNGPLAEAITGLPAAGEILAELSRTNAFVSLADSSGESYRYHRLLADLLDYLLKHESAARRRRLMRRAARWYGRHGRLAPALRFATESRDWGYVARVVAGGGFVEAMEGRVDLTVVAPTVLDPQDADDPGERDERLVARAAIAVAQGKLRLAREALSALRRPPGALPGPLATTARLVELMLARAGHDVPAARHWSAELSATGSRGLDALARHELAMTLFYAACYQEVVALLTQARDGARASGLAALEADTLAQLSHVEAFAGRIAASVHHDRLARLILYRNPALPIPAALVVASAGRSFGRADLAAASATLGRLEPSHIEARDRDLVDEIKMDKTLLLIAGGRLGEAKPMTDDVGPDTCELVAAYQAFAAMTIETALGRPNAAVRALRARMPQRRHVITDISLARALSARGELDEAAALLADVISEDLTPLAYLDAATTNAQIAVARGRDENSAVRHLVRGIDRANGRVLLPLALSNTALAELRGRFAELADRWPAAADVRLAGEKDIEEVRLVEPLTDREQAVLRWMATTMSINEIADELCLSLNTVKTHIAAIYRKLAAPRRRDAVLRARELELL